MANPVNQLELNAAAAGEPDNEHWQRVSQQVNGPDLYKFSGSAAGAKKDLTADVSTKPLTETDMQGQSADDVRLARNYIFAEHGRQFKDDNLQKYFNQQPWYHASDSLEDGDLTPLEQRNVAFLHIYELDHNLSGARNGYDTASSELQDKTGQLLPNDQTQPLTSADLAKLSDNDLRVARNEILARHGYNFNSPDLKEQFSKMPWYKPADQNSSAENSLSWMEERNLEFIQMNEFDRKNIK